MVITPHVDMHYQFTTSAKISRMSDYPCLLNPAELRVHHYHLRAPLTMPLPVTAANLVQHQSLINAFNLHMIFEAASRRVRGEGLTRCQAAATPAAHAP